MWVFFQKNFFLWVTSSPHKFSISLLGIGVHFHSTFYTFYFTNNFFSFIFMIKRFLFSFWSFFSDFFPFKKIAVWQTNLFSFPLLLSIAIYFSLGFFLRFNGFVYVCVCSFQLVGFFLNGFVVNSSKVLIWI